MAYHDKGDIEIVLKWVRENKDHDVTVCDCCGDGETWHGNPGEHDLNDKDTYAYNGGMPECY